MLCFIVFTTLDLSRVLFACIQLVTLQDPDSWFWQHQKRADILYPILPIELIEQEEQEDNKEEVKLVAKEMPKQNPAPGAMARPVRDMEIPRTTNVTSFF